MMKSAISFLPLFIGLLFLSSCINSESIKYDGTIDVPNAELREVLSSFQKENILIRDPIAGLAAMRVFSVCDNLFAEVWLINHEVSFEGNRPSAYTFIDERPVFIYSDENRLFDNSSLTEGLVKRFSREYNVQDMNLPPNTGYGHKWIYQIGKGSREIFSVVDTLLRYDDLSSLHSKLDEYTGRRLCY